MSNLTPTFEESRNQIRIPNVGWAKYYIDDKQVSGVVTIDESTTVVAKPNPPSHFREDAVTEWTFTPGAAPSEETQVASPPPPPPPEASGPNLD